MSNLLAGDIAVASGCECSHEEEINPHSYLVENCLAKRVSKVLGEEGLDPHEEDYALIALLLA